MDVITSIKYLKCPECSYVFPTEIHGEQEELIIQCPYCKKKQKCIQFEEEQTEYGTGYRKDLDDLKDVLEDASRSVVKSFFAKDVKIYTVIYTKGNYIFKDLNGQKVSIEKVNQHIQSNVVLQRIFYNLWMGLYR
ncbi:MAG: hypothetical protein ACW98I_20625 [Candidatus Hodarchaeales archaeon]